MEREQSEQNYHIFSKKTGWALLAALACAMPSIGHAYIGNSYLTIDGVKGSWQGDEYRDAIKADGHIWLVERQRSAAGFLSNRASFSLPPAPREGEGELVLTMVKDNPGLATLMAACESNTVFAEVKYAEPAGSHRSSFQYGPRPPEVPEYIEYRMSDVRVVACPRVDAAPDQAFVVHFDDIEWLNFSSEENGLPIALKPPPLPAKKATSGDARSFVVTWIAVAHDVSDEQCAAVNVKPEEKDYYALMTPAEAERERARLEPFGGVSYENGQMGFRGPLQLDVTKLPGIVPDPGMVLVPTKTARGLHLASSSRAGKTCERETFVAEDGRTVNNQLYRVQGCVAGWQGRKGFIMQFANNAMRDGAFSIVLEVSGIDDYQNDDSVDVTIVYSDDPMAKSGSGEEILTGYSFRPSDTPEGLYFTSRHSGRIVDGVIITDPVDMLEMDLGGTGTPAYLRLAQASLELEIQPDGTLKGLLGGYRDWREIASIYQSASSEFYHGFQQPAMYNALRREADGLKNPVTGQCDGISTAFDIEAAPAFLVEKAAFEAAQRNAAAESMQ